MNPQEPVIPDPDVPGQTPDAPVSDPSPPGQPAEYGAAGAHGKLDDYDKSEADSFPASDPPAASEPGGRYGFIATPDIRPAASHR